MTIPKNCFPYGTDPGKSISLTDLFRKNTCLHFSLTSHATSASLVVTLVSGCCSTFVGFIKRNLVEEFEICRSVSLSLKNMRPWPKYFRPGGGMSSRLDLTLHCTTWLEASSEKKTYLVMMMNVQDSPSRSNRLVWHFPGSMRRNCSPSFIPSAIWLVGESISFSLFVWDVGFRWESSDELQRLRLVQ